MFENKKFIAIIPARGGSKGIPHKNIIDVCGRPLIDYTISVALQSKYIDDVIVSTDDAKIAEVSVQCGAEVPFMRPDELGGDKIRTIDVLVYTIEKLKSLGRVYDYVVLLQPTQPMRLPTHIDEAIKQIVDANETSLVSVNEVHEHPILMRTISQNGHLKNFIKCSSTIRRQDFPKVYKVNGAIYINKLDATFNLNVSLNDNRFPYFMDEKFDVDIDTYQDLNLFKFYLKSSHCTE